MPWYHTLDLPGGIVTPGRYDLRDLPARLPIPSSLEGLRCLDVGSFDRLLGVRARAARCERGRQLDLDDGLAQDWQRPAERSEERAATTSYARRSFELARRAFDSSVTRVDGSVYDIETAGLGEFDFVFVGSLLLHLRDPIGALVALRNVTRGSLLSLEPISPVLALLRRRSPSATLATFEDNHWWIPNPAGHLRYLTAAGFTPKSSAPVVRQRFGAGYQPVRSRPRSLEELVFQTVTRRRGVPSSWVLGSERTRVRRAVRRARCTAARATAS